MFGDKSTYSYIWIKLEWSKHAQKRSTRIFCCTFNKGQLPIFYCKKTVLNISEYKIFLITYNIILNTVPEAGSSP